MVRFLKEYWDIILALILAIISGILTHWEYYQLQLIYIIIMLLFVYVGCIRMLKIVISKPNKKTKNRDLQATNPAQVGEKRLGELILEILKGVMKIMEKVRKFFKWLWTYRQQLVGLFGALVYALITIYAYVFDKFGWLLQYFPQTEGWALSVKIGVGVLSAIFLYYSVRNQVKWCGVGSLASATNYLNGVSSKTASSLSPSAKKAIAGELQNARKILKSAQSVFTVAEEQYNHKLKEFNTQQEFIQTLVNIKAEQSVLATASEKGQSLSNELNALAVKLNEAKTTLAQAETQVANYEQALKQ